MNDCQRIQFLSDKLLNSTTEQEKLSAKNEMIRLCQDITGLDEEFKSIEAKKVEEDLDLFLKNPAAHKNILETLKISMKQLFYCPDIKSISR